MTLTSIKTRVSSATGNSASVELNRPFDNSLDSQPPEVSTSVDATTFHWWFNPEAADSSAVGEPWLFVPGNISDTEYDTETPLKGIVLLTANLARNITQNLAQPSRQSLLQGGGILANGRLPEDLRAYQPRKQSLNLQPKSSAPPKPAEPLPTDGFQRQDQQSLPPKSVEASTFVNNPVADPQALPAIDFGFDSKVAFQPFVMTAHDNPFLDDPTLTMRPVIQQQPVLFRGYADEMTKAFEDAFTDESDFNGELPTSEEAMNLLFPMRMRRHHEALWQEVTE